MSKYGEVPYKFGSTPKGLARRGRLSFLKEALDTAPHSQLSTVIMLICQTSDVTWELVESLLAIETSFDDQLVRGFTEQQGDETSECSASGSDADSEDASGLSADSTLARARGRRGSKTSSTEAATNARSTNKTTGKRSRARLATCMKCDEEFDIMKTDKADCRWHEGEMEINWEGDFWADHDENCHGRIEDFKDEYPEGFTWSCCGRGGERRGCKQGSHSATKRRRLH